MSAQESHRRNRNTLIILVALVVTMLAFAFASVPLYRIFCQQTGYGGTTQLALGGPTGPVRNRVITVRFNADVHRDLPWGFRPLQVDLSLKAGELGLAFYQVKNKMPNDVTGIAVYNVTPEKAAVYFNKVHCFCFEEQVIAGNDTVDMPVQFFIDGAICDDPACDDIKEITLSYMFFSAKDPNIPEILGLPNATRHQMRQYQ